MPKRLIDLFAGCGGMSLGFQNAGFDVLAAYDNWQPAIDIYSRKRLLSCVTLSQVSFCHSPLFMRPKGTKPRTDMISLSLLEKTA